MPRSGWSTLSDESPILDIECRTYGEYAGDMTIAVDPPRKWWQAGPGEGSIGFTESKITKVLARGNRQVPEVSLRGLRPNRHEAQGYRPAGHQPAQPGVPAELARGAGAARGAAPSTPSTSAATCSPPASRSTWTAPSPTARSRRATS